MKRYLIFILALFLLTACATPAPIPLPETPTPPLLTPNLTPNAPLLTWSRQGGLAGFCDEVIVRADGTYHWQNCREMVETQALLAPAQRDQLLEWQADFQPIDYTQSDPATADSMTIHLTLAGTGTRPASEADLLAIQQFIQAFIVPTEPPLSGGGYPQAALNAQADLAAFLGLSAEQVQVIDIAPVNWPDSCLGAAGPTEMCMQVITPGYQITLAANDTLYEYHTNTSGTALRRMNTSSPRPPQG